MKIVEIDAAEFDNFAKNHDYANPWQTSNYGEAVKTLGYNILYLNLRACNKAVAGDREPSPVSLNSLYLSKKPSVFSISTVFFR